MSNPTPPPGWYPDGHTANAVRWFDGQRWTEHVTPLVPAPMAYAPGGNVAAAYGQPSGGHTDLGPSNGLHWVVPIGRSWQSIVAGYMGLVALFLWPLAFAGPVGIAIAVVLGATSVWLGVLALRRAASGGHGRGRAWFAVVAGVLCLVLTPIVALTN